jgi:hypothetical protein
MTHPLNLAGAPTAHRVGALEDALSAVRDAHARMTDAWIGAHNQSDNLPDMILTPDTGYPFAHSLDETIVPVFVAARLGDTDTLETLARILRETGTDTEVDFPGTLRFTTADGRGWLTGHTGWHVHDDDGHGQAFPAEDADTLADIDETDGVWTTATGEAPALLTVASLLVSAIADYNAAHPVPERHTVVLDIAADAPCVSRVLDALRGVHVHAWHAGDLTGDR